MWEGYDKAGSAFVPAVNKVAADVAVIRGFPAHAGSVRKALNRLVKDNYLVYDPAARPAGYRWNAVAGKPSGYQPTAQVAAIAKQKGTAKVPEARGRLRGMLKDHLDEVTGIRVLSEQVQDVPDARKPRKTVKRASGETYVMRDLYGRPDVEALQQLRDENIFALLYGPPGTGKTALVEAAFPGLHTIAGDENTSTDNFAGQWYPTDVQGKWFWVDGPMTKAMKNGEVLFVDDITLIDSLVLAVMYPAMDGRGEIILKDHIVRDADGNLGPERVKIQPGFYVIGAHNPGARGAYLPEALASRFRTHIRVESDLELAASLGVPQNMRKLVKALLVDRDNGDLELWIPQLREMLTFRDISQQWGETAAAANLLGLAPAGPDRDKVNEKLRVIFRKDIPLLELGGQLGDHS